MRALIITIVSIIFLVGCKEEENSAEKCTEIANNDRKNLKTALSVIHDQEGLDALIEANVISKYLDAQLMAWSLTVDIYTLKERDDLLNAIPEDLVGSASLREAIQQGTEKTRKRYSEHPEEIADEVSPQIYTDIIKACLADRK